MSTTTPTQKAYQDIQSIIAGTVGLTLKDVRGFRKLIAQTHKKPDVHMTRQMRQDLKDQITARIRAEAFGNLKGLKETSTNVSPDTIRHTVETTKDLFTCLYRDPRQVSGLHFQTERAGRIAALAAAEAWTTVLAKRDAPSNDIAKLRTVARMTGCLLRMSKRMSKDRRDILVAAFRTACAQCRDARTERMTMVTWFDTPESIATERAIIAQLHQGSRQDAKTLPDVMKEAHKTAAAHAISHIEAADETPLSANLWARVATAHLGFAGKGKETQKLSRSLAGLMGARNTTVTHAHPA